MINREAVYQFIKAQCPEAYNIHLADITFLLLGHYVVARFSSGEGDYLVLANDTEINLYRNFKSITMDSPHE